ncbi:hypothetical protein [Aeromonas dhakensis]|uniref:hypothetical protein n=1 Tax=Aeromonas dhakensis TaxID=196024 RepID=UPI001BFC5A51|nr:hypothetical protein [Aeromonas dhakensis]HDT5887848.1 hypothetical protein [Aeromonas dhakensis]HEB4980700.1 hypothetical protein [Aeromonas dhakensis]
MTHLQVVKPTPAPVHITPRRPLVVLTEQFQENLRRVNAVARRLRQMGYRIVGTTAQGRAEVQIMPDVESSSRPILALAHSVLYDRARGTAQANVDGVMVTWQQAEGKTA